MSDTALAFQSLPESDISKTQMDALDEFRRSLRESYAEQRLPGQAQLVDRMMEVCGKIISQYPELCKCNLTDLTPKGGNKVLCTCCTRMFKAAALLIELEKLATKRQAHEANLINNFLRTFADMLATKTEDDEPDEARDRIYAQITTPGAKT